MDLTIICEFSEVSFSDNMILGALSVIFFFFWSIWYIVAITAEQMLPIRSWNQLFVQQKITVHRCEVGSSAVRPQGMQAFGSWEHRERPNSAD